MKSKEPVLAWSGLVLWTIATPIAILITLALLALYFIAGWPSFAKLPDVLRLVINLIGGLFMGSIVGAIDWITLNKRANWARNWFVGTVVGWGIGAGLLLTWDPIASQVDFHLKLELTPVVLSLISLAIGAAMGFGQWVMVRRSCGFTAWWIIISSIIWAVAAPLGYGIAALFPDFWLEYFIAIFLAAIIVDLMTGIAVRLGVVCYIK